MTQGIPYNPSRVQAHSALSRNIFNRIAITREQSSFLLKFAHPVSLPSSDLQGRVIQLWKFHHKLLASLVEGGLIYLLSGHKIHNALLPNENGIQFFSALNRLDLSNGILVTFQSKVFSLFGPCYWQQGKMKLKPMLKKK